CRTCSRLDARRLFEPGSHLCSEVAGNKAAIGRLVGAGTVVALLGRRTVRRLRLPALYREMSGWNSTSRTDRRLLASAYRALSDCRVVLPAGGSGLRAGRSATQLRVGDCAWG